MNTKCVTCLQFDWQTIFCVKGKSKALPDSVCFYLNPLKMDRSNCPCCNEGLFVISLDNNGGQRLRGIDKSSCGYRQLFESFHGIT